MANWWEVWSPGLQAMGGVVELIGAWLLAREWAFSRESTHVLEEGKRRFSMMEHAAKELEAAEKRLEYKEGTLGPEPTKEAIESIEEDRKVIKALEELLGLSITREAFSVGKRLYWRGFGLIIIGVFLQVTANGIAWAGARGLFS